MENKERLKKSIIGFIEYLKKTEDSRGNSLISYSFVKSKNYNKEFYLEFEKSSLSKKSQNIQNFLKNRKQLQLNLNVQNFTNGIIIPKVLRYNHLERKNKTEQDEIMKVLMYNSILHLGCHNISDRISVNNPKKYKSLRTMFTFPHYGLNDKIKEITKGKLIPLKENTGIVKRIIDEDGYMWINHSINLIKEGNEWKKIFPNENNIEPDWKESNPKLFQVIKNGVVFDVDMLGFSNRGIYNSLKYKYISEFDFENFTLEELEWVKEWLDWEFISLTSYQQNNEMKFFSYGGEEGINIYDNYISVLEEIGEEKGYSYLKFLLVPNIYLKLKQLIENFNGTDLEKTILSFYNKENDTFRSEFYKDMFDDFKMSWEREKKEERTYDEKFWTNVSIEDNFKITSKLTEKEKLEKSKKNSTGFIENWVNFSKNEINEPSKQYINQIEKILRSIYR